MRDLTWCDASSNVTSLENVLKAVGDSRGRCEVHVGCDSHLVGGKYVFALVIALYEPKKGGTYFFARKKITNTALKNIKVRLLKETEESLAVANMISENFNDMHITVHLDINPNKLYKSYQVLSPATSWVKSFGYSYFVKPEAWASSWLADAYAK